MSKIIKINIHIMLSKIWSGLVAKTLVHFHEVLGSTWWMCVLMYIMCIYINVSCTNMKYEICMMVVEYLQNIFV
jgi:hypothetical protein